MSTTRKSLKLPTTVQVGPFKYTIKPLAKEVAIEGNFCGDMHQATTTIRVSDGMDDQVKAETLLHEILHACFRAGFLNEEREEKIVCILATQLAMVLRDNPKVIEYITKALREA